MDDEIAGSKPGLDFSDFFFWIRNSEGEIVVVVFQEKRKSFRLVKLDISSRKNEASSSKVGYFFVFSSRLVKLFSGGDDFNFETGL